MDYKSMQDTLQSIIDNREYNLKDGVYDIGDSEYLSFRISLWTLMSDCERKATNPEPIQKDEEYMKYRAEFDAFVQEVCQEILLWIEKHPTFYYGEAYSTDAFFFIADKPTEIHRDSIIGSGFNYGSTNLILDCPKNVLILAEND